MHTPLSTSAALPLWSEEPTLPTLLLVERAPPSFNLFQLCARRSWKRGVLFQTLPEEAERAQSNEFLITTLAAMKHVFELK